MNIEGLEGVQATVSVINGDHHHRFYFTKNGHHHALDLVVRKDDVDRMSIDPAHADRVFQGFVRDARAWFKEANDYGQEL